MAVQPPPTPPRQRTILPIPGAIDQRGGAGASQVAIAAAAGMVLFHEPPNPHLLLGVCLTIVGILGFDRPAEGGGL